MLRRRNAINLQTAKGAERQRRRVKAEEKKVSGASQFPPLSFVCVCVCVEGGASVLTDTGSSWVVQGLDSHTHTHTPFCVQINVTPTPLWSPLPLSFFSISGLHSCTPREPCALKSARESASPARSWEPE